MGRKPFISKGTAKRYDLLYSSAQDPSSAPQREWVEISRKVGIGKPDAASLAQHMHKESLGRYPGGHPLAWLDEEAQPSLSEGHRQEIMRLGFPDDGYDYLQHMRQGHGSTVKFVPPSQDTAAAATAEPDNNAAGPSQFVPAPDFQPPPADYKAIDASRLTIHQAAADEEEASLLAGGASGFSRELQTIRTRYQKEIDDMETLLKHFEGMEGVEGDLLEDFVLSATEVTQQDAAVKGQEEAECKCAHPSLDQGQGEDSAAEEEVSSREDEYATAPSEAAPSEGRSFASTYWRPERHDRRGDLSVIDERFEQLLLEYDSDEIGDLEECDGRAHLGGGQSTDRYSKVLDQFLAVHNTQDHAHDSGHAYNSAAQTGMTLQGEAPRSTPTSKQLSTSAITDAEKQAAVAAIAKAKEHLRRLEAEEAEAATADDRRSANEGVSALYDDKPRENWDCESILSGRSTAYNHPKRLDDHGHRRHKEQNGRICLSQRTGLPHLQSRGQQSKAEGSTQGSQISSLPVARRPDESTEEKRLRKGAVKEAKRQARATKKELKLLFKDAVLQQQRQTVPNASVTSLA